MSRSAATLAALLCLAALLAAEAPSPPPLLEQAKGRLARLDGTVVVPGLHASVEVRRDRWGVPHIYATTQHDLFLAQGYVVAQDRLWQMEMTRRAGEGRLAEVLGPEAFERDRFARLLRYRGDMAAEWESYGPDAREIVRAFVAGVNAYVAEVRDRPPIEFTLLGIAPEPWAEEVPLLRLAAFAMTGNAWSEVLRARRLAHLGAGEVERLWPLDPPRRLDPAPGMDYRGIDEASLGAGRDLWGPPPFPHLEGSNNWALSGKRTASGKPVLANDPHRALTVPALRYLVHLVAPGWNVIGAGEPHLPGVAAGHNQRVAFGFTIVGMDQQDLYVEQVGLCGPEARQRHGLPERARCYKSGEEERPVRVIEEKIRVKGEEPREVRLELTEHGPIVAEDRERGRAFALRFVGAEPGTAGYLAQIALGRAEDWRSFLAAAARWKLPTENLVYADVDGNIGWVAAGLMPRRGWSGLLPVPGDGRFEWQGFLPFEELPRSYNPPSGLLATANHNVLPPGYPHALSYEWAAPFRVRRITDLLGRAGKHTVEDSRAVQQDERSLLAERLVPVLVAAARAHGRGERAEVRELAAWDFRLGRESRPALLFEVWLEEVARRLYEPRMAAAGLVYDPGAWDEAALLAMLTAPEETEDAARRDEATLAALDDALAEIGKRLGPDRARWTWGALHRARFRHPLAAAFDLPDVPRGGDANTVNATAGPDYLQRSGASFRQVLDLGDWDRSVATSVPGQSGQPGSPHYGDLLPLWAEGGYFPLLYSRRAVRRETAHLLRLVPPPPPR